MLLEAKVAIFSGAHQRLEEAASIQDPNHAKAVHFHETEAAVEEKGSVALASEHLFT